MPEGMTRHRILPQPSRTQTFHRLGGSIVDLPPMDKLQIALVICQGDKVMLTGRAEFEKNGILRIMAGLTRSTE